MARYFVPTRIGIRHPRVSEGAVMRNFLLHSAAVLLGLVGLSAASRAQTSTIANSKPGAQAQVPDLSGDWGAPLGAGGGGFIISDPGEKKTGTAQDDTPYQPWALAKLNSERPEGGPRATFENTTDPRIKYCDPIGVPRIYLVPTRSEEH